MVSPRTVRQKIHEKLDKDDDVENDAEYLEAKRLSQLHSSEISVITDDYDDVFSDFDPRSLEVRELSVDFIDEVKRASRQKGEHVELRILVPKAIRDSSKEDLIRRRLHAYFKDGLHHVHRKLNAMRNRGILYVLVGMVLMLVATYVSSHGTTDFLSRFLFVFFEPAGWFVFWTGLEIMLVRMAEKSEEHEFYRKMSNCEIKFISC